MPTPSEPAVPVPPAENGAAALFDERGPEWLAAVARRHSRRVYDGRLVDLAALGELERVCTGFTPYPDARAVLVRRPSVDIFTGILGSYGKVRHAPHVLVLIGAEDSDFADEHVGYTGEAIILEAASRELDTCWIGGFFSAARTARLVELARNERVFAVSPVGYATNTVGLTERAMRGFAHAHHRKHVDEIAAGPTAGWPDWAIAAVETARLAPSAVNRQPWRFRFEAGALVIARDNGVETPRVTKRLDCGIAMLHAELGARATGVEGAWRDLSAGLDVARFVTTRRAE